MDFILRNLEALGDEVAAALDDLADEVTGRTRHKAHESDMDDDGASDDRSVASAADCPGTWGASDLSATGSDTASCTASDNDAPPVDPRVITLTAKAPAASQPMCGTSPDNTTKRRKAPHLVAVRIPTPPDSAKTFAESPPPVAPSALASPPAEIAGVAGPTPVAARMPGHARRRPPAAAASEPVPQAVSRSPPPSIVGASQFFVASPPPTLGITPAVSVANSPPPPRRIQRRRSSEFDLCDRDAPITPTVDGEFLVI